jgi:hypothetical protein
MPSEPGYSPETPPLARRPKLYYPALLPGMAAAVFLFTLWWIGTRYEVRPPSEFAAENVIQQVVDSAATGRLHLRASRLYEMAESVEVKALENRMLDTVGSPISAQVTRLRARADSLRFQVFSREVILAKRHAKRVLWVYAFSVDATVCILAGLIVLVLTFGVMRERQIPSLWALGVLAAMVVLSLPPALLFMSKWYDAFTPPFDLVTKSVGKPVLDLVRTSDGLHIMIATLITWGGVFTGPTLLTHPPAKASTFDQAFAERELAEFSRLFRLSLYVISAMLVVYVAAVSSLFQWVLAFVQPDAAVYGSIEALANSAVTARALLASGLLVFGSGTSAAVVRYMAMKMATNVLPEAGLAEHEEWAQKHALVGNDLRQRLKTLAVILAPFITGVLAQVLQKVALSMGNRTLVGQALDSAQARVVPREGPAVTGRLLAAAPDSIVLLDGRGHRWSYRRARYAVSICAGPAHGASTRGTATTPGSSELAWCRESARRWRTARLGVQAGVLRSALHAARSPDRLPCAAGHALGAAAVAGDGRLGRTRRPRGRFASRSLTGAAARRASRRGHLRP